MSTVLVQTGETEPISALLIDSSRSPIVGLTNIEIRIRRASDGWYFDWDDDTFKVLGLVTTLTETLTEVDATGSPGVYHLDTVNHVGGFDTSAITNPAAGGDHYIFTLLQNGSPQDAVNTPMNGELAVGDWVDFIDQAVSSNATPSEVETELRALRLHQLVSEDPGVTQADSGTYIRQIVDALEGMPQKLVLQSYAYSPSEDKLRGSVWVENLNLVMSAVDSASVEWVEAETETVLFTISDLSPDARGFFYVEKDAPGLVTGKAYYARSIVTLTAGGTVSGGKGAFVF